MTTKCDDTCAMYPMGSYCIECVHYCNEIIDFHRLLELAEHVTRSTIIKTVPNINAYIVGQDTMDEIKKIVQRHLGGRYLLKGGKKIRPIYPGKEKKPVDDTWEPDEPEIAWMRNHLSMMKDGGVWGIPSACTTLIINHKTKTYKLNGDRLHQLVTRSIKVLDLLGWQEEGDLSPKT